MSTIFLVIIIFFERFLIMKLNKTQGLLYIFNLLISKKKIAKEDILNQIEISDLTFRRYMQELRAFFYNFYMPYEVRSSRSEELYILVEKE